MKLVLARMITIVGLASTLIVAAQTASRSAPSTLNEDQRIRHLLNRISYGPRPGDVDRVKRLGVTAYIEQQLHPSRIDDAATDTRLASLESLHIPMGQLFEAYPAPQLVAARQMGLGPDQPNRARLQANQARPQANQTRPMLTAPTEQERVNQQAMLLQMPAYYAEHHLKGPQVILQELQAQKLIRAVSSERQLEEVLTDFWFNHFNVYWPKQAVRFTATDFELQAIRPHVLGKFRDLLGATAKSPAMMYYLDNFLSASPDATPPAVAEGRGLNPVVDQLRLRKPGLNENYARELMELHTLGVDGGYSQRDVVEVARAFTGWSADPPQRGGVGFVFHAWMHDKGEKTVLGHVIPAGGGMKDGEIVLDILAHHPSTAQFIATKLVRRFVNDDPPRALVERVARTYANTDGDIREMVRTILTSPEFFSPEHYGAKIKSPFEVVASAIRALGTETNGSPEISRWVARMGEPLYLYQAPTGYPDRADQWVNTGGLVERMNFALALTTNRIPGTPVAADRVPANTRGHRPDQIIDHAAALVLGGQVSPQTRAIFVKQLKEHPDTPNATVGRSDSMPPRDATRGVGVGRDETNTATPTSLVELQQQLIASLQGQGDGPFGGRTWEIEPARSPIDSELARALGLALGSPEFQRK